MVDPDCDFCAIAGGRADATIVCEGDSWLAFFPLRPATLGHTLVVPRDHVSDLWSTPRALGHALMDAVVTVGLAVERAVSPEGMNLISSAGSAAEQTVGHLHLHIVPRWNGDGFGQLWPEESTVDGLRLDKAAVAIRAACADPES